MKTSSQSMDPQQAAQAFFGLDDADFDQVVAKLAINDPRLVQVFQKTRARYLQSTRET